MANLVWVSLLISSLFTLVLSQLDQSPQNGWTQPDGTQADYTLKYYDEDTLKVEWRGWSSNETDNYLHGVTVANLWVTSHSLADDSASDANCSTAMAAARRADRRRGSGFRQQMRTIRLYDCGTIYINFSFVSIPK